MDTIRIEGIKVPVFLGAGAAERRLAQSVVVDVEVQAELAAARYHDSLDQTLDYAKLHAQLLQVAQSRSYALVEHLGHTLLNTVVMHPRVIQATLTLRKPGILGGATPSVRLQARRKTRVALGLGANIGDPHSMLAEAIRRLSQLGHVDAVSALYRSEPWGVIDQPAFLNCAALLETLLIPQAILAGIKNIERDLGRQPGMRWGPRAIDIDVLDDAGNHVHEADLIIPHPYLYERAFALVPLAEIAPEYLPALERLPPDARLGLVKLRDWPTWCNE